VQRVPKIQEIKSHKNLNSRGDWTVDTVITLDDSTQVSQTVPDGASKGEREAVSIEVERAVDIINHAIHDALVGESAEDQAGLDGVLIAMDGTDNKSNLGGNSMLSVSLGVASAVAKSRGVELWEYLAELYSGKSLERKELKYPTPVFNILNGGKHADNGLSFQEFMVIPSPEKNIEEAVETGVKIYHTLANMLKAEDYSTGVGDEGGFAPQDFTVPKALEFIRRAAAKDYEPGKDVFFGMDVAAESFHVQDGYELPEEDLKLDTTQLMDYYSDLFKNYELIYIEDPFYERDEQGWADFYSQHSDNLMVVADDLVVTNTKYLKMAVDRKLANAVIVKPNQVGTLTETLEFIKMARKADMKLCVSHRSGDTAEDSFIADLALAVGAEFMKAGAPVRGERVVKYNRLLDVYYGS
jgi:enolase